MYHHWVFFYLIILYLEWYESRLVGPSLCLILFEPLKLSSCTDLGTNTLLYPIALARRRDGQKRNYFLVLQDSQSSGKLSHVTAAEFSSVIKLWIFFSKPFLAGLLIWINADKQMFNQAD